MEARGPECSANAGAEVVTVDRGFPLAFSPGTVDEKDLAEFASSLVELSEGTVSSREPAEDSRAAGSAVRLDPEGEPGSCYLGEDGQGLVAHLVQDEEVVSRLQAEEAPPSQCYDELREPLRLLFPDTLPHHGAGEGLRGGHVR